MSKWDELVDGAITRPTWGELVGRVDSWAKWLVTVDRNSWDLIRSGDLNLSKIAH